MANWATCPKCGRKFFKYEVGSSAKLNIKCGGCKSIVDITLDGNESQVKLARPKVKFKLDPGAFVPVREHAEDAGIDLMTPVAVHIAPHGSAVIDTGAHVEVPRGYAGFLKSKSGLNIRADLVGTGTIDAGYTGTIVVKLYNLGDKPADFLPGQKIIQLVIVPVLTADVVIVPEIEGGARGEAGFGSTGA